MLDRLRAALAEEIALFARVIPLMVTSGARVTDADDDPVIEAAIAGGATHVVTGDSRLHHVEVEGLEVLTPMEALRVIEQHERNS